MSLTTTRETLQEYFEEFGEITECIIMQHKESGNSKGFGFVTFRFPEVATQVAASIHHVEGRRVDCKKARPKDIFGDWDGDNNSLVTNKIFVGGLPDDIMRDEFIQSFYAFGDVIDSVVIPDKQTDMSRSFGFVQFSDPSAVDRVMENYYDIRVRDRWVECKRAVQSSTPQRFYKDHLQPTTTAFTLPTICPGSPERAPYNSYKFEEYNLPKPSKVPECLLDSPPLYPTPLTPPHMRMGNYRSRYLRKRAIDNVGSEVSLEFNGDGPDFFRMFGERGSSAKKLVKIAPKADTTHLDRMSIKQTLAFQF